MQNLRIAGIQFDIAWENKVENIKRLEGLIKNIPENTDLLVLPEMFTTGFSMNPEPFAEGMNGSTIQWMKDLASSHNMAVCGSIMIKDQEIYRNRFIWIYPEGAVMYYDKAHPFCLIEEGKYFEKGQRRIMIGYKGWRFFPSICYDLRFPVWNRNDLEYDVLINVANWPSIRSYSWKHFLISRAMENQAYVVGINRVGKDIHEMSFSGDSAIISYDGKPKIEASPGKSQLISETLDSESLINYRNKYPFAKDRDEFNLI